MGANAQTSVPTFTAGDVLTAANMNISARTGVPVFADTTARDAGFGGTGEKTLAEGQLCYVENLTGVAQLQYYDGAAWVSLPATGLVYITGAAFTAASSVSLPNSTFTSTYRNYRVILSITANTTDDTVLSLRMRASGTDDATGYFGSMFGVTYAADTLRVVRSNNATSFGMGVIRTSSGFDQSYSFDVFAPQVATETNWAGVAINTVLAAASDIGSSTFAGMENSSTQFDSLSFIPTAGTVTGTYRVYGYTDS